jgi:hypothetical protein
MPPIAILLLSSHGHVAASAPGPLAQAAGFLFVLLATALIVVAVEHAQRR